MGYRRLRDCVDDLQRTGQLVQIDVEVDPYLEATEIQRRVYAAGGPAIYYSQLKGCRFPAVSNLFGTVERTRFLFRDLLEPVRRLIELKIDPTEALRRPWRYLKAISPALAMRPRMRSRGPAIAHETTLSELPQIVSWPRDGGPFVTLPEVYSEHPDRRGWRSSNLGMYRVQIGGGKYAANRQAGLHYQIHRSIGVHHAAALRRGEDLPVNVFVGGSPAMILSAVMPLPEGLSELMFAGALEGRGIRMIRRRGQLPIYAEADFCISGRVRGGETLPEGPFGDHLGYYSLAHDFPVLTVDRVTHRPGAIWPFTAVGRPPQEDTSFGAIIHEITGPLIPTVLPGVKEVHAVDAAGVHPLLLAIGSERYVPYATERRPQEILTAANAILGQGQLSLAKYLFIVAGEDDPTLDLHDIAKFLSHLLCRADWRSDLHFQTRTTIDTLDYSGTGFNQGSKLVIAAAGSARYRLHSEIPQNVGLPAGFSEPCLVMPGVVAIRAPAFRPQVLPNATEPAVEEFCKFVEQSTHLGKLQASGRDSLASATLSPIANEGGFAGNAIIDLGWSRFRWIVLVDDSEFTARNLDNFLWVTFTRSNPASDVHGVGAFTEHKHWGCRGPLVIDARQKPHHAPPLIEDPAITRRVDQLAAPGGPLHGIL